MNFFKKPIIIVAFALLALPNSGFAQYHFELDPLLSYFSDSRRYELSFNYLMPFGEFAGMTRVTNGSNTFIGDTDNKRNIVAASGFGGDIGLSLPFKRTGHISCWAVNFHLMGNMYAWHDLNQSMGLDGTLKPQTTSLNATTIHVSLPIGIDWKIGNDAICTKRLAFGTSLGAGFIPQVNMTSLDNVTGVDSKMSFGCTPYAKAELSIFAGLDVKLRVMYTLGDILLIDVNKGLPASNTDAAFRITSTSNLIVSFIIMPFSGGWHEWAWYNTYDNYNQHDRLN